MNAPPRIREEFTSWFDALDWKAAHGVEWVRVLNGAPDDFSDDTDDEDDDSRYYKEVGKRWARISAALLQRSPADYAWLTVMGESGPLDIFELYPYLGPLEVRYYGSEIDHPAGIGFTTPWLAIELKPGPPERLPPGTPPSPSVPLIPFPPVKLIQHAYTFAVSLWDRPPSLDELRAVAFGNPYEEQDACIAAVADPSGPHTLWCSWRRHDYWDAVSRVGAFRGNLFEPA